MPADPIAPLRDAYFAAPDSLNALRVWADALLEAGDPRGEFIQLSALERPTAEQQERREAMLKKLGGKLVGPARPFVRGFRFDETGLVSTVMTEAPNLIDGFELISQLNPRLQLIITSLRSKRWHEAFSKLALSRFSFVNLVANQLADESLQVIAPAFRGLRRLGLARNNITGSGLRAVAEHLGALEFIALDRGHWYPSPAQPALDKVATVNGWVEVLCEEPAFANLKLASLGPVKPDAQHLRKLEARPGLKVVYAESAPSSLEKIEALIARSERK